MPEERDGVRAERLLRWGVDVGANRPLGVRMMLVLSFLLIVPKLVIGVVLGVIGRVWRLFRTVVGGASPV